MTSEHVEKKLAETIIQRVAELPDRTSPDDWPEAMLVTADELREIIAEAQATITALSALQGKLDNWRHWAQFVYGNGGPIPEGTSDAQLQAAVCEAHSDQIEAERAVLAEVSRRLAQVTEEKEQVLQKLYGITPEMVVYTAERDIRRGESVQVRVPKPFIVSGQ